MNYEKTDICFLHDDLIKEYGHEQGEGLYTLMCRKYSDLCDKEVKSENNEINNHVFERLLPTISMYLTLIENAFPQEEALMMAHKEIPRYAHSLAVENARLTKIPFT